MVPTNIHSEILAAIDSNDASTLSRLLSSVRNVEERIDLMYQPIDPINWDDVQSNLNDFQPSRPYSETLKSMANTPLLRCLLQGNETVLNCLKTLQIPTDNWPRGQNNQRITLTLNKDALNPLDQAIIQDTTQTRCNSIAPLLFSTLLLHFGPSVHKTFAPGSKASFEFTVEQHDFFSYSQLWQYISASCLMSFTRNSMFKINSALYAIPIHDHIWIFNLLVHNGAPIPPTTDVIYCPFPLNSVRSSPSSCIFFAPQDSDQKVHMQLLLSEVIENCHLSRRGYFNTPRSNSDLVLQLTHLLGQSNSTLERENILYSAIKGLVDKAPKFALTPEDIEKISKPNDPLPGFFTPWDTYALSRTSKKLAEAQDPTQFIQALQNQGPSQKAATYTSSKAWGEITTPETFNNFLFAQDLEKKRFNPSPLAPTSMQRLFDSLALACHSFATNLISRVKPRS